MSKKPKASKKTASQSPAPDLEPVASAAQTPPHAQPLVLLPGMKTEGNQLEEHQLRFCVELATKHPAIPQAVREFQDGLNEASKVADNVRNKYKNLVVTLRDSKLNRRESTLLLKSYDFNKVVISKICNLVEADDAVFAQYLEGAIGFNAAVLLTQPAGQAAASGGDSSLDSEAGGDAPAAGASSEAKKQEKENPFPKAQADSVFALLEQFAVAGLKPTKNGKPYVFTYQAPNSVRYFLTCSVL